MMSINVEIVKAIDAGKHQVFLQLTEWLYNGHSAQIGPLTRIELESLAIDVDDAMLWLDNATLQEQGVEE